MFEICDILCFEIRDFFVFEKKYCHIQERGVFLLLTPQGTVYVWHGSQCTRQDFFFLESAFDLKYVCAGQ